MACDPTQLTEDLVALLASMLAAEPILVVARPDATGGLFGRLAGAEREPDQVSGRALRWIGPGRPRAWSAGKDLGASGLRLSGDTVPWATLEGAPVIAARRIGRGVIATLGFHPSRARDTDGVVTALLRHLLIWGAEGPVAWLDLTGSLILRMDDPGGAQNVYLRSWSYPKLGEAEWTGLCAELRRRSARLSIAYTAGWVDDGDATRGTLRIGGRIARRVSGRIHPSPLVQYWDRAGHSPGTVHDYQAEFRGIQALRKAGLGDVELHGYTHMHPDAASWAGASNRYEATWWFRELGEVAMASIATRAPEEHPLALGMAALARYFKVYPTTLICPGDEWTDEVLERALSLGLHLVSNSSLALRHEGRFCWVTHVCAPYLNGPGAGWFTAGLPIVGYFHDRDPALEGVAWIGKWLDSWRAAGAERFLDLREFAAMVGRRISVSQANAGAQVVVTSEGAPSLVRPVTYGIKFPNGSLPSRIPASADGRDLSLEVRPSGDGDGRFVLPS